MAREAMTVGFKPATTYRHRLIARAMSLLEQYLSSTSKESWTRVARQVTSKGREGLSRFGIANYVTKFPFINML